MPNRFQYINKVDDNNNNNNNNNNNSVEAGCIKMLAQQSKFQL